jgi:RNA polymerase sigma-70 factor, ECF subfamily
MAYEVSDAGPVRDRQDDSAVLDCSRRCYRVGQSLFKRIAWPEVAFASVWKATWTAPLPEEASSDEALRDEYLRLACLNGVAGAVETLELEYIRPLETALTRRGSDIELVEETLQVLRQKLLLAEPPALASYKSTGHLRAWLLVVATRTSRDLARQRGVRWSRQAPLVDQLVTTSTHIDVRLQKNELDDIFAEALREVVRSLPSRERYALRMHILAGWNVSQIGEAMSTHRATAARWIAAAKERINRNVRNILKERLDLTPEEAQRVFSLLSTHLNLRLSQVFETVSGAASCDEVGKRDEESIERR